MGLNIYHIFCAFLGDCSFDTELNSVVKNTCDVDSQGRVLYNTRSFVPSFPILFIKERQKRDTMPPNTEDLVIELCTSLATEENLQVHKLFGMR